MKKILFSGLAILTLSCSTKQETAVPEAIGVNQEKSLIKSEMQAEESPMSPKQDYIMKTLSNGLEVYMFPKHQIPMVTVLIAVKNGAYVQTPDIEGLAHLYEHMFFKANEKIPSQPQFMAALDRLGVELGPNMNAYTSTESVRYFFTIQSRFLKEGIEFMSDAVISPKFLPEELEKERQVVIGEFDRYESSPLQVFFQKDILQSLFTTYFTRKNTIGSREVILKASPEQMRYIQKRFYIPNNSALFLVGDFDPEKLYPIIEEYFSRWAAGPDPFEESPIPEHPKLEKTKTFVKKAAVETVNVVQAYQGPSLVLENKDTIAFDLMSIMLSLESSAFQKELIHSGLASNAYFYSWSQRYTSPLFFSLETSTDKASQAYLKMKELIERISKGGFFTEEELKLAKDSIEVRSAYDREVGQKYALALAAVWTSTGSLDYYTSYIPEMRKFQLADIDAALDRFVSNKPYVFGALVPENAPDIQFQTSSAPTQTESAL